MMEEVGHLNLHGRGGMCEPEGWRDLAFLITQAVIRTVQEKRWGPWVRVIVIYIVVIYPRLRGIA